jgi:hypothetical protein
MKLYLRSLANSGYFSLTELLLSQVWPKALVEPLGGYAHRAVSHQATATSNLRSKCLLGFEEAKYVWTVL